MKMLYSRFSEESMDRFRLLHDETREDSLDASDTPELGAQQQEPT
jgi:hypothetical protein